MLGFFGLCFYPLNWIPVASPSPASSGVFTVSGSGVSMVFVEFFMDVVRTDAPVCLRTN